MPRRDECLISNYEEAINWLAEFKHTVTDEQALRVIEYLSSEKETVRRLQGSISILERKIAHLKNNAACAV